MSEDIKKRVGRPIMLNKARQFLLTFTTEEEVQLLENAKKKALEWNIPLKAIFNTALKKWVNGTISYEEITSGKDTFIIQRKEIIPKVKKRLPKHIAAIENEPWFDTWAAGIPGSDGKPLEEEEL
jgi:hypothetical protein